MDIKWGEIQEILITKNMFDDNQEQQIGKDSIWIQIGGDNTGNINIFTMWLESIEFSIIKEIIDYMLRDNVEMSDTWNEQSIGLPLKIELNFNKDWKVDFFEAYTTHRNKLNAIARYLSDSDQDKVQSLVLKVRQLYQKLKKSTTHRVRVDEISIFTAMAERFLPKDSSWKSKNGDYLLYTYLLTIHFFEMCEYWILTEEEKQQRLFL